MLITNTPCMLLAGVCEHFGKTYRSGEPWSPDACTDCICDYNGQVNCASRQCPPPPQCRVDEKLALVEGQCCPSCVPQSTPGEHV